MQSASQKTLRPAALKPARKASSAPGLNHITRLAARFFDACMAQIVLLEHDRIRLVAQHGLHRKQTRRQDAVWREAILGRKPLVVRDTAGDPRFAPAAVRCPPAVRFYASVPLILADGSVAGAIAVMDTRPRTRFPRAHADALRDFAALAAHEFERPSAAPASAEASEGFSDIAGALPAMVWLTDTAGHCTLLNRFPWDPSGPGGANGESCDWHNVIPPEERETDGKADLAFECRIQGPGGEDRWILEQARPRFQADGSFAGYIGLCLDITDRKRAEMELLASREQLRQLAAHVESAREQERIRIAREVHDELGQVLTVFKMDLEAVQDRYHASVARPLKDIGRRISLMLRNLDVAICTVRRIASELRPGVLDHLGIAAAIEWQMQQFQSHTGIPCHAVGLPEELPLDAPQSTAVFRIFQEILTNICRHASATAVKVEVDLDPARLALRVSDNGRGFDKLRLSDPKALGLLGMRERALLLGGTIDIQSRPGVGTMVTLQIPLSGAVAAY